MRLYAQVIKMVNRAAPSLQKVVISSCFSVSIAAHVDARLQKWEIHAETRLLSIRIGNYAIVQAPRSWQAGSELCDRDVPRETLSNLAPLGPAPSKIWLPISSRAELWDLYKFIVLDATCLGDQAELRLGMANHKPSFVGALYGCSTWNINASAA